MKTFDYLERIKKLNKLIRSSQTGTPAELAAVMGMSQSHLFRCMKELENFGMKIQYSRSLKTYFYVNDDELTIFYSLKLIAESKTKEILGGMQLLSSLQKQIIGINFPKPTSPESSYQ